jgi:hypothetical protein
LSFNISYNKAQTEPRACSIETVYFDSLYLPELTAPYSQEVTILFLTFFAGESTAVCISAFCAQASKRLLVLKQIGSW